MGHRREEQPGLRLRLGQEARRISSQHRQLDDLHAIVTEALARGAAEAALTGFRRLRDALDAHMSLENEIHFPALHGLRPELEAELTALAHEHESFWNELAGLSRPFELGDLDGSARALDAFATRFAEHERREESLLASIRLGA
jgi:hypothetical protein